MEIGKWNMAQRWRNFKRPASSKGMWKQFVADNQWPVQNERMGLKPGGLVEPGVTHYATDGREKPLARQIKQVYAEILEETGRKPYIAEVMERVTLDKSKTLDNKRVNIKEVLKRADLELTPGMTTQSKKTRIAKSGETIKQTKRVENFLSDTKKTELFEDIRTYRKGVSRGPDATMNIREFAKYFPEGTSDVVISRQVNRVANEILKLPPHPKKTPQELLDARKVKYDIMKAGDPEGKFKKIPKEPGKHRHHMRMKGMKLADKIIAISPSLADISYLDVVTNSEKLQNFERIRNDLGKELLELRETKPEGWERRVKEINALAKRASQNIPKNLRPHLFFETMDEAGNLKPIGGWKTKAIDPTSTTPFSATTRAGPKDLKVLVKDLQDADIPCVKGVGGQCTRPEDYRKGFNEVVERSAAGDKKALTKLQKFTQGMKKVKGPAKWTWYGLLAEIGFMVPFAVADYTTGKSWKRILGNASDWGFGPMFGQSEDEEIIANLPEESLGAEAQEALAANTRLNALTDPNRNFPQGRIGMDPKRFQEAQTKVIEEADLDFRDKINPFMEGPRNQYLNPLKLDEAFLDWEGAQNLVKEQEAQRIQDRRDSGFIAEEGWEKLRTGRMGRGRVSYLDGGIVSLLKK